MYQQSTPSLLQARLTRNTLLAEAPVRSGQKTGDGQLATPGYTHKQSLIELLPFNSHRHFAHRNIQCFGNTLAIGRISLVAVSDMTNHDMPIHTCHVACGVLEQPLLLFRRHQTEQVTRLSEVVVIIGAVIIPVGSTLQRQRWLAEVRLLLPLAVGVGLIVQASSVVAIDAHGTIAMVAVYRAARRVDRNLVVVNPQAVALGIAVGEQPPLQHAVRRVADAGYHVGRSEGRLLYVLKIVLRVAVKLEIAHLNQWIVLFRPDLGQIERMEAIVGSLGFRHDLYVQGPAREVLTLDSLEQVALDRKSVV